MHCHIQFITTPTVDTPGTGLVLHFDDKRYFFGQAHEGLQRASLQHGSKVLKVRELFLTGTIGWQTAGGLLGTMLTLADAAKASLASQNEQQRLKRDQALRRAKVEEERWLRSVKPGKLGKPRPIQSIPEIVELTQEPLGIHGGPNITHMLATARSFVFRQGTPMDVDEIAGAAERTEPEVDWPPTWQDAHVKVWALPITSLEHDGTATLSSPTRRGRKASSRKRDLAHYMNGQQQEPSDLEGDEIDSVDGAEDRAQKIREHVVHEMFRSAWRFDNLVETALADVKMPAKLFTRDPETKSLRAYDGPVPDGTTPVPNINVLVREPWPGALVAHLPPTTPSSIAMSYIVRNHKQRGRFMAKVAKGLGVPPQMNSQLARGEHVTLNDGTIVTPDQVLEAGKEGGGAAIIDIPSKEFIPALLRRPEWHEAKVMTGVGAFIWILGPGVARDTSLVGFMEEFKDCKHIISSPEHCPNQFMMSSAAVAAVHHHLIDPERYALLQHHNISSESAETIADVLTPVMAQPGLILQLEPTVSIQDQQVQQPVNLIRAIDQISPAVLRLAKRAKDDIKAELAQIPLEDQNLPSPGAEIICLGTGSALPSLHRNVAGTLLRVPGYGSYLFDAGENTLGQLKRIYSSEELVELFRDLKMIWISHLHADHHLGVAAVIKAWYEVVHGQDLVKRRAPSTEDHLLHVDKILDEGRRLFVVGSSGLTRWLYEYSSVEDYGYDQLVPLEVTAPATAFRQTKFEWNCVDVGFSSTKNASMYVLFVSSPAWETLLTCKVATRCAVHRALTVFPPVVFPIAMAQWLSPSRSPTVSSFPTAAIVDLRTALPLSVKARRFWCMKPRSTMRCRATPLLKNTAPLVRPLVWAPRWVQEGSSSRTLVSVTPRFRPSLMSKARRLP